ncbi:MULTISPECIES: hypothetical protein [Bacteria]|uniref:hypothetical protein n=1 Tax=Bacteria TaxID=2 RepID=UPI003C7E3908
MSGTSLSLPEEEQERTFIAFADAVDRLGEEAQFLAANGRSRAARYLEDAHRTLVEARITMHRLQSAATDSGFRRSARRRIRALAAAIANAGLRDIDAVRQTVQRLDTATRPPSAERPVGWSDALRTQAARATAWSVEKWTGSPLSPASLESSRTAQTSSESAALILRREEHRLRRRPHRPRRSQRTALVTGIIVAGTATAGLAGYGGWALLTTIFGG